MIHRRRTRAIPLLLAIVMALITAACTSTTTGSTTNSDDGSSTSVSSGSATTVAGGDLSDATLIPPIKLRTVSASYEEALFEANNLLIEAWEELGLQVENEVYPGVGEILDAAADRDYHAMSFGYSGREDRIEPNELLTSPFQCGLPNNYADYCYEPYDELLVQQRQELDPNIRQGLVAELQEIQALDVPWVTVYHPDELYAYNPRIADPVIALGVGLMNWYNIVESHPSEGSTTLTAATDDPWRSINPMAAERSGSDVQIQKLVFDTLTKVQPDGTVGNHLAESWEYVDDTTVSVTLREAYFTDGERVTADDVKFSYDYFREWEVGNYAVPLLDIESVDVIAEDTVHFNLVAPSAAFPFNAMANIMVLPEHIWATVVEDNGLSHPAEWQETALVGSGPYIVDSVVPAEAVTLVRNDDFWGGPAGWESFVWRIFADSQGMFRALQDGSADMHWSGGISPDAIEQIQSGQVTGLEWGQVGSTTTRGIALNMAEGNPLRDYYLRLALAHTYDKDFAVDVANRGFAKKGAGTIAPDNTFWYNDAIPQEEIEEGQPHWHQLDLGHAREILSMGGYRWDDQGRLHFPTENYVPTKVHFSD